MKNLVLYSLFVLCSMALHGQEQYERELYSYDYKVVSNTMTITFIVDYEANTSNISYKIGSNGVVNHQISDISRSGVDIFTYVCNLNDSKNFVNGDVYIPVTIEMYVTYKSETDGNITPAILIDSRPIQITDGSVELVTEESRATFKVKSVVGIECLLTSFFARDVDYSITISGPGGFSDTDFGKIYSYQQNSYFKISSFVPQVVGKYAAKITISELGISDVIEIIVDDIGSDIERPGYESDTFGLVLEDPTELVSNAPINATGYYTGTSYNTYSLIINGNKIEECVDPIYEDVYGPPSCNIKFCYIPYENEVYGTQYVDRPSFFENPIYVRAQFCVWSISDEYEYKCEKEHTSGEEEYKVCIVKSIEVKPIGYDKYSDNYVIDAVPDPSYTTTIELFTNDCAVISFENLNDVNDDLEWMTNLTMTDKITFTPEPNFTDIDRNVEIDVYLDEQYEKCFAIIDGEKQNYRQIFVRQPSAFTKVNPAIEPTIQLSDVSTWNNYNASKGDVYYIKYEGVSAKTKYVKNPSYVPVSLLTSLTSYYSQNAINVTAYNENNEVIAQTVIYFDRNQACITTMNGFVKSSANVYIKNVSGTATLGATALNNTSLLINAGEKVDLNTGFRANSANATYFRARIKPCTVLKSDDGNSVSSADSLRGGAFSAIQPAESAQAYLIDSCQNQNTNLVYPIPTKGKLTVEIPDYEENTTGTIEVYTVSGSLILQTNITSRISNIDISGNVAGVYVVRIKHNGVEEEWQVIKN